MGSRKVFAHFKQYLNKYLSVSAQVVQTLIQGRGGARVSVVAIYSEVKAQTDDHNQHSANIGFPTGLYWVAPSFVIKQEGEPVHTSGLREAYLPRHNAVLIKWPALHNQPTLNHLRVRQAANECSA